MTKLETTKKSVSIASLTFIVALLFNATTYSQTPEKHEKNSQILTLSAQTGENRENPTPRVTGLALGLFSNNAHHDYEPHLREIAALGASHVAVVLSYFQQDVFASQIEADPRRETNCA